MLKQKYVLIILSIIVILMLNACFPFVVSPATADPKLVGTAAAATVEVRLTEDAFNNLVIHLTEIAMATQVPLPVVNTATRLPPTPTLTNTPTLTSTPIPPTLTPIRPTATLVPPTATPVPCNWAQFIADVTIPDGTKFAPNTAFTKTWRLKNIGSCTWTSDYDLVFISGSGMNTPATVGLTGTVRPGETMNISVNLVAPNAAGNYTGKYMLRSATGITFGIGAAANTAFWVQIEVSSPQPTHNPGVVINFLKEYCSATWTSTTGTVGCPSPSENFTNGSIQKITGPVLEGGYHENETALITIPSNDTGGIIQGKFPAFTIQSGQKFTAVIGCLDKSPDCNVMFKLDYIVQGQARQNLASWTQVSDGKFNRITVDLSALHGKLVNLILVVDNNNGTSKDDRAFWLVPTIIGP